MKNSKPFVPWNFEKFKDDACVYSVCPDCNFGYPTHNNFGSYEPEVITNYCPNCGERRWNNSCKVDNVIINQRYRWKWSDKDE